MPVPSLVAQDDPLDTLAEHCVAAREAIDETGSAVMRQLIDLLLFEVGLALADRTRHVAGTACRQ